MSVATLIQKITHRAREKQNAVVSSYRGLVRELAAGETVDETVAADVLDAAGKSPTDLAAAVGAAQERDRMRVGVKELSSLQAKLRGVEAARTKADATFASARAAYQKLVQETQEQSASLSARIAQLENHQRALWAACDDPGLRARDAQLNHELQRLHAREQSLAEDERVNSVTGGPSWRSKYIVAVAKAKELRAKLAAIEKTPELVLMRSGGIEAKTRQELADTEATIAAIEAQEIEPATAEREAIAKRRAEINAQQTALVQEMQLS